MLRSLVGSEMCIRDRFVSVHAGHGRVGQSYRSLECSSRAIGGSQRVVAVFRKATAATCSPDPGRRTLFEQAQLLCHLFRRGNGARALGLSTHDLVSGRCPLLATARGAFGTGRGGPVLGPFDHWVPCQECVHGERKERRTANVPIRSALGSL